MRSRFDLVVFDFDGTICDSIGVKTDAFYELYRPEFGDEFAERVRSYHLAHQGVSRYDKIRYVEESMLGRPCSEARLNQLADRFGSLVEDGVVASSYVNGVEEFFENKPAGLHTAVASATPDDELKRIVKRRGIESWFEAVEGSPRPKTEILHALVRSFEVTPDRTLMVGDQLVDLAAAVHAGTGFLGIAGHSPMPFPRDTALVDDLTGLTPFLDVGTVGTR